MKRLFFWLLLLSLPAMAKLQCVVSIPPLQTFLEAIGGTRVTSAVMVPRGSSPHSYEPRPSQMRSLEKADCYLAVGVEFEKAWLPRFAAQNPRMLIVDLSEGIKKYPVSGASKKSSKQLDPHIWTAPSNVRKMARKIYETLVQLDESHREEYKNNYQTFLKKIDKTDRKIRALLAPLPPKSVFMVFHPSWGYFAREYGLIQMPVEIEGKAPKPRQLMELIRRAKAAKVRAIFTQPEFSDKSARLLAAELKIPVVKISPLDPRWSETLLRLARAIAGAER